MNNTKICNPKTEVSTGFRENDRDYLNSCLSLLKDMEKNYVIALTEASNESLFEKYNAIFDGIKTLQRDVFELAFVKGWYTLDKAEKPKIDEKYTTLKQEFDGLNG